MITFSITERSEQSEIMDNFDLKGEEMKLLLTDLKVVNSLLGGTAITLDGIKKLLQSIPKTQVITILDIGCGDGELLRKCANFGKKLGYTFKLIGVDANAHILEEAAIRSSEYNNITFKLIDVFSEEKSLPKADIILCTLFLHHFKNSAIVNLLQRAANVAKVGVVVNDLQRSAWAFNLFKLFSSVFIKTKVARHDGLVSIARGFTKEELQQMTKKIKGCTSTVHWKWAFRYQWILKKNHP